MKMILDEPMDFKDRDAMLKVLNSGVIIKNENPDPIVYSVKARFLTKEMKKHSPDTPEHKCKKCDLTMYHHPSWLKPWSKKHCMICGERL